MTQKKSFYVTTPIYYGNGLPHVGHFYSSTIANILYKYHKISGAPARFTTGIDENSQKAVIKAEEAGMDIMEYLDYMAGEHQKTWDYFNIDYTDFVRTTSPRHKKLVQEVLMHCYDVGDIYQDYYEGKYCIGCEAYKKEDELIPHPDPLLRGEGDNMILVCPDHLKEPDVLKEKNYFFRLSKYQTWIEEFFDANPDFVLPHFRYNEVKAFVSRGLEDFSISRETNTFGIPLPFDESQVTYVWFDALFNYYTSCKYSRAGDKHSEDFSDESKFFWESDDVTKVHVVGKDIIRFHAIFWPAMLASYFDLGELGDDEKIHYKDSDKQKLPNSILCGGHFTVDGHKMSKSLGNVIEPIEYSEKYSRELLVLYMLSAFSIGNDGDYNRDDAIRTYNAKLANNFGNLVNRLVALSLKLSENTGVLMGELDEKNLGVFEGLRFEVSSVGGTVDDSGNKSIGEFNGSIKSMISHLQIAIQDSLENFNLKNTLDICFSFLDSLNKFADETQPWQMIKTDEEGTREVLYMLAEGLRQVGLALYPFFPEKMSEMFEKLGLAGYCEMLESGKLHELREKEEIFKISEKGSLLFMRFDLEEK